MNETTPASPRRRLQELLSIPERDRSDADWDEINELEISLAPGNRLGAPDPNLQLQRNNKPSRKPQQQQRQGRPQQQQQRPPQQPVVAAAGAGGKPKPSRKRRGKPSGGKPQGTPGTGGDSGASGPILPSDQQ